MDVAGPYPITSTGNQYCLIVGCYFSKWLECFPIPDQKARTVARKLVYEIVARYGAFRELHSNQGTNLGSARGVPVVRNRQDEDYPVPPTERCVHRTKSPDAGTMPESSVPRDKTGVGRARAAHLDELPGYAPSQHGGDPQHDDAWPADATSGAGHVWDAPAAGRGGADGERVRELCTKNMTTTARCRDESTRPESWCGFMT